MGNKIASKDYDIIITDPALTEHGFTRFSLPLNGNASVMVVHNIDKSKMMYPTFYKSDLDKTVQSLREKISSDGILIDDDTADSLVRYFRNECISLSEDKHSEFFKNGNGNGNNSIKNEENETNCNYEIADDTSSVSYNASHPSQASHVSPNSSDKIDCKNNDSDAYWTRGKWRDYLPPQKENEEKK